MPVTNRGRLERDAYAAEMVRLATLAAHHKGKMGPYLHNPSWVHNPSPHEITYMWSNEDKIPRRKYMGWQVVTAEDALTVYQIPPREIDRAANCARRNGQVLMVTTVENAAGIKAEYILRAEQAINKDNEALVRALGSASRDVDHDKERLKESGHRRKFGPEAREEAKTQRANRIHNQIMTDMKRSGTATQMNPEILKLLMEADPESLLPQGVDLVDGVREVVLTEDPMLPIDDFGDGYSFDEL